MDYPYPVPTKRRLAVYAFDPSASVELATAVINDAVIELPWELPWEDPLEPGPVNEYLEIVDYDPACGLFYHPLDLNHPHLQQEGLPRAEGDPGFHQQMVFAVGMLTIRNFERALGRPVFWAIPDDDPRVKAPKPKAHTKQASRPAYPAFAKRLRVYPHAMRAANAYFSPAKGALLFGYFKTPPRHPDDKGEWVFTCLSQDIIAHETAHAILHGMRRRGVEPSNPDSLAFHEAFADIVALLQHFNSHNVVAHELGRSRGVLRSANLLTGLASQFGHATGRRGPLRMALEALREEQSALEKGVEAKPMTLRDAVEPHERGQFLVAAVFDAFVTIFEARTADLFRIAGVAPGAERLPDALIDRLAREASRTANQVLGMCVRGLDYLPPASATFGDYLRAVVTADYDIVSEDPYHYRVAFAEAFRKREIPVTNCISYAPASLCWEPPDLHEFESLDEADRMFAAVLHDLALFARLDARGGQGLANVAEDVRSAMDASPYMAAGEVGNRNLRDDAMRVVMHNQAVLHAWLAKPDEAVAKERAWEKLLGIRTLPLGEAVDTDDHASPRSINARVFEGDWSREAPARRAAIGEKPEKPILLPVFDVHSVRIARRTGPQGKELYQMIAQVTQKRRGYFDEAEQRQVDAHGPNNPDAPPDFWLRGGATIIVDLRDGTVQRIIRQRIDDDDRLRRQRDFILGDDTALAMTATALTGVAREGGCPVVGLEGEPFAFVHAGFE